VCVCNIYIYSAMKLKCNTMKVMFLCYEVPMREGNTNINFAKTNISYIKI
jgi:hypothetical protein